MFSKSTVKYIQSLQHKKFRDEEGLFIAEGPKLVKELLEAGIFTCRNLYALPQWVDTADKNLLKSYESGMEVIKDFELEKISSLSKPNLVLGVFEKKKIISTPDITNKITLVLDDIQDPGNLGTIIRIADWFAVENIICSPKTADMYNPKVVQSTMASLQRVNLFYTEVETWLKNTPVKKYAAALDGEPIKNFSGLREGILIIGNESKGISEAVFALTDKKITIPRIGEAESLNAAVATGIILYGMKS
ncbi:MAG: RNA methyltransferase [Sphingobacteriales bacterium]|nr:MAG: RNA methyltransferase [Sphingobacteriales bacterium]